MSLLGAMDALRARHLAEERDLLRRALAAADWNLRGAARILGISPSTVQHLLGRHSGIDAERRRRTAVRAAA